MLGSAAVRDPEMSSEREASRQMRIAPMSVEDLGLALEWAAVEGWNPGLDDAAAFHAADPAGFLMGWIDREPVASIAAVRHSPDFGFVGLFIVKPRFRGRGLGRAIWDAGIARLGDRTVGLDGVVARQATYRRAGFAASHRTLRYQGEVAGAAVRGVVPVRPEHLPAMLAFDREASGVERSAYLTAWFRDTRTRRTLVLERDGEVAGFGTIRSCRRGAKVGPLRAADYSEAKALLTTLALHAPAEGGISLDVPEPNHLALQLARDLFLEPGFETARMYKGPPPGQDHAGVFAEASLELG
jgi:GNAT superfamily N-acetyltransferase